MILGRDIAETPQPGTDGFGPVRPEHEVAVIHAAGMLVDIVDHLHRPNDIYELLELAVLSIRSIPRCGAAGYIEAEIAITRIAPDVLRLVARALVGLIVVAHV